MHGGVQRLGIVTDSSSYYRYYGKDNKWIYSIVQGDYDLLQRMRDDAERNSLRLRDMGAAIDRKYDRLVDQYNKAESTRTLITRRWRPRNSSRQPRTSAPKSWAPGQVLSLRTGGAFLGRLYSTITVKPRP